MTNGIHKLNKYNSKKNYHAPTVNRRGAVVIQKKVLCITTGETFESLTLASRATGVSVTGISRHLKNETLSVKGFQFSEL